MQPMHKAVIFDMDGVIADSEYYNIMAKHVLLKKMGIEVDWRYHDQYVGRTYETAWEAMIKEFCSRKLWLHIHKMNT